MFKLEIRTENAAFQDGMLHAELAEILRDVAHQLETGFGEGRPAFDSNGNSVGKWTLEANRD